MRTAVLAVSFGTTHLDALRADIVPVEEALADAFPGCPVYRAFTSGVVRRRLRERQNMHVDSVEEAIAHINCHSTGHSEAILPQTRAHADLFTRLVDSAAVYVNASTRFTDGGQFGLGCEMGISTQKLHARGPMGLEELTSYKYVIHGDGQIR